jgi:hypothetical protein
VTNGVPHLQTHLICISVCNCSLPVCPYYCHNFVTFVSLDAVCQVERTRLDRGISNSHVGEYEDGRLLDCCAI